MILFKNVRLRPAQGPYSHDPLSKSTLPLLFLENTARLAVNRMGCSCGPGAPNSIVPVKEKTRRHSCPNLSKFSSLLVSFLSSRRAVDKLKKSLSKSLLWKNPQCPNTKNTSKQDFSPALTVLSASTCAVETTSRVDSSGANSHEYPFSCISPMNSVVASFKLTPIQANRGLPC